MSHACNNTKDNCLHCVKEENAILKAKAKPLLEPVVYGRVIESNRPVNVSTEEWVTMATLRVLDQYNVKPRFALLSEPDFARLQLECGAGSRGSFLLNPALPESVYVSASHSVAVNTLLLLAY